MWIKSITYLFVVAMKYDIAYLRQKQFMEDSLFGLRVQEGEESIMVWGQGANGRHCCRGRKLSAHALNQRHETERVK